MYSVLKKTNEKKILLAFVFSLTTLTYASDHYDRDVEPVKSFHDARDLIKKGKYEEAFIIHQRMFNNIDELRPKVFSLHVHNLIYDWHLVAKKHEPAMKAFLERRDDSEARIRDFAFNKPEKIMVLNPYAMIAFSEFRGFNEYLNEDSKTLDLFYEIKEEKPEVADKLYFFIKDVLLREKKYATLAEYQSSAESSVRLAKSVFDLSKNKSGKVKVFSEKRFVKEIQNYIDIYIGNDEVDKANKVRELALESLDTEEIRDYRK